jgi:hypothetical protein
MQTRPHFKFTSRIASEICAVIFTNREKSWATIFKERCKSASVNGHFIHRTLYPLISQGFYDSPKSRRWPRGVPRDGQAMTAKHPARQPAKFLTSNPNHVPVMAGQSQWPCRRTSVKTTRKTTCVALEMGARCPRRKLARRLATQSRNSRGKIGATVEATSRKMAHLNFTISFNRDIQKL